MWILLQSYKNDYNKITFQAKNAVFDRFSFIFQSF